MINGIRITLGILLIVAGIAAAVFVGGWLMLIGGIIQVVDAVQQNPIDGMDVAIGVVRIVFFEAAAAVIGLLLVIPGYLLLTLVEHKGGQFRLN